jgi:dTDP-4-amino-4,6-dideoxy-D-galactose acyltransferase
MNLQYLEWDTGFFRIKIGRIDYRTKDENVLSEILNKAKRQDYKLLYVFAPEGNAISTELLDLYNGNLVDRKVRYEQITGDFVDSESDYPTEYVDNRIVPELENLAYASGNYSRFKLDKNLNEQDFYALYKTWIEKAVSKELADKVFVFTFCRKIHGMVTLTYKKKYGEIGLIAVDKNLQGKGVGRKLIEVCKKELSSLSINKIMVNTQMDNHLACSFYEKNGFNIQSITNVYHFWI